MEEPSDDFIENGFKNEQEAIANYAYNSTTDTAKKLRDHLVSAMKLLDQERGESEIEAKFNRLTPANQKSVMDMIDFLLAQQKAPSVKGEGS
jgi:predicted transcriptional regulator